MRLAALLLALATECQLCPSDPCDDATPCPGDLVCTHGQCAIPCETTDTCPAGSVRCVDPDGGAARVCVDADGVPGQACLAES